MNIQYLLASRPSDGTAADDNFSILQTPIPTPGPNQMLTRTIYLSLDPYQWNRWRSGRAGCGLPRADRVAGGRK